jgi:hypothetical protein
MAIKVSQLNQMLETEQDFAAELPLSAPVEESLREGVNIEANALYPPTIPAELLTREKVLLQSRLHEVSSLLKNTCESLTYINPLKETFESLAFVNPLKDTFESLAYVNPLKDQMLALGAVNPLKDQMLALGAVNPLKAPMDSIKLMLSSYENISFVNPLTAFGYDSSLQAAYQKIADAIHNSLTLQNAYIDYKRFVNPFVDRERIRKQLEEVEHGRVVLEASDFDFLEEFISPSFVAHLARLSPEKRNDALANLMWSLSRGRKFRTALKHIFSSHPKLARRWPSIEEGIYVHCKGKFIASASTLIFTLEGMLLDVMEARGEAIRRGRNIYAVDNHGNIKRDADNKRISLMGMHNKLQNCQLSDLPILMKMSGRLLRQLPSVRNNIAHGEVVLNADRTLSTRLTWAIYALSYAVAIELIATDIIKSTGFHLIEARDEAKSNLSSAEVYLTHEVFASTA